MTSAQLIFAKRGIIGKSLILVLLDIILFKALISWFNINNESEIIYLPLILGANM